MLLDAIKSSLKTWCVLKFRYAVADIQRFFAYEQLIDIRKPSSKLNLRHFEFNFIEFNYNVHWTLIKLVVAGITLH